MDQRRRNLSNLQRKEASSSPSPKADEMITLTLNPYTNETNFTQFKKRLRTYVLQKFSTLDDCIQTGELEELELYTMPDAEELAQLTAARDPGGLKAHVFKKQLEDSIKEYHLRDMEVQKLFGFIMQHLSPESLQRVMGSDQFSEIETDLNGFRLWTLVENLHTTGDVSEGSVWKKDRVLSNYYNCCMKPSESLIDYFHRFKEIADNISAAGETEPTEELQTIQFIKGLDATRFAEFKMTVKNLSRLGVDPPATLSDALSKANSYDPILRNSKAPHETESSVFYNASNQQSQPDHWCRFCGRRGHLEDSCWKKNPHLHPQNKKHQQQRTQNHRFSRFPQNSSRHPQSQSRQNQRPHRGRTHRSQPHGRGTMREHQRPNGINNKDIRIGLAEVLKHPDEIENIIETIFMSAGDRRNIVPEKDYLLILDNGDYQKQ